MSTLVEPDISARTRFASSGLRLVASSGTPSVAAVVLTMGDRPAELARALSTLQQQRGVLLDVVVVGNGWRPEGLPAGVRGLHLPDNVGIPEGRNLGAAAARGEFLFFYDDDASLPSVDALRRMTDALGMRPDLAVVQPRGEDPAGLPRPRRWVPRLHVGDGTAAGDVTLFWEGVCVVRRAAFDAVGGWPGRFWYGHEGIDLAYRLVDAGWRIRYEATVVVHHPATSPTRHAVFHRMNARNRVWVARRNLPALLVPVYLGTWAAITLGRVRDPRALRTWCGGFLEGLRTDPGPRRPMRWRTVGRLTRLGRPPLL